MSWQQRQYEEHHPPPPPPPLDPGSAFQYGNQASSSSTAEPRPTGSSRYDQTFESANGQAAGFPPAQPRPNSNGASGTAEGHPFDILAWHGPYQECQRYFLDHGQYEEGSKILMAFINMKLPYQFTKNPLVDSQNTQPHPTSATSPTHSHAPPPPPISLHPYIRRLLATSFCRPPILSSLFGPTYRHGLSSIIEIERRNYLFAAKSVPWAEVKRMYDMGEGQVCPFLMPLEDVLEEELRAGEAAWGRWLEMGDWMVGDRAPGGESGGGGEGEEEAGREQETGRGRGREGEMQTEHGVLENERMDDIEARRYRDNNV